MGNCLERSLSENSDEDFLNELSSDEGTLSNNHELNTQPMNSSTAEGSSSSNRRQRCRHRSHHHQRSIPTNYTRITDSLLSLTSANLYNGGSGISSSLPNSNHLNNQNGNYLSSSFPPSTMDISNYNQQQQPVYYLSPNVQRTADQLTEADQIKLLKRMTLIQQLPLHLYNEEKKNKEYLYSVYSFFLF
jgi:hypothetical protein